MDYLEYWITTQSLMPSKRAGAKLPAFLTFYDMDNCIENQCQCERACYVLNKCVFTHPLVIGNEELIKTQIKGIKEENGKTKAIQRFLQSKQPFKVTPKDHARDYFNRLDTQYGITKKSYKPKKVKKKKKVIPKTVRGHIPTSCDYKEGRIETMEQFLKRLNSPYTNFHLEE